MATDNVKCLIEGVGNLEAVSGQLLNLPESDIDLAASIRTFVSLVKEFNRTPEGIEALNALLACTLNQDFRKTGYLWRAEVGKSIRSTYFMGDNDRGVVADLAGL